MRNIYVQTFAVLSVITLILAIIGIRPQKAAAGHRATAVNAVAQAE